VESSAEQRSLGCLKACSFVRIRVSAESVPVSALLSQAQGGGPVKPSKRSLISLAFYFFCFLACCAVFCLEFLPCVPHPSVAEKGVFPRESGLPRVPLPTDGMELKVASFRLPRGALFP
jgi:hypothetical protein